MKQILLNFSNKSAFTQPIAPALSFRPFYQFLKQKVAVEKTLKRKLYQLLIGELEKNPQLLQPLDVQHIGNYLLMLEMIYAAMTGLTIEEDEILWGIGLPASASIFYGTDALFDLIKSKEANTPAAETDKQQKEKEASYLSFIYATLLQRFYGYQSLVKKEMVHHFIDPKTGLVKYYSVHAEPAFVEVTATKALPPLDFRIIENHSLDNTLLDYLTEALPLSMFNFVGFTIFKLQDISEKQAIDNIKNSILSHGPKPDPTFIATIMQALKTLGGNQHIHFGFIPFIRLNKKLFLDFGDISNSIILRNCSENTAEPLLMSIVENFTKKHKPIFFKNITDAANDTHPLRAIFDGSKTASFALIPLFYNNNLTGALEVYTGHSEILTDKILFKIEPALTHLAQLMQNAIDDFKVTIAATVNEKFTAIQPAVQWKFNEAAAKYMQAEIYQQKLPEPIKISFEHVYPLYGAIDIRNSSIERNKAIIDDHRYHLQLLIETFTALQGNYQPLSPQPIVTECQQWQTKLNSIFVSDDERRLNTFIEEEVLPEIERFDLPDETSKQVMANYLAALDVKTGKTHENRRALETSMQLINQSINHYLELMGNELQQVYPCYFDKFRTDGVEYDIYVGQAISPDVDFTEEHLNTMRLWQLKSMAAISKLTYSLLPQMPKALHTTQLIYINGETIDISFRNDEKRFDVEGAYNIRYQMIKKRIDKVHIKHSSERLTQPGKIALVYFNEKDVAIYLSYIAKLQQEGILNNDLEHLELEELQGVSRLKALRVGVSKV